MTKPDLTVTIEPSVSDKITYLPLGAPTADGESMIKIVLRLNIKNNYSDKNVEVTEIKFVFPSSSVDMKNVNNYGNMNIGPLKTVSWSNGLVDLDPDPEISDLYNNSVFLLAPAPTTVTINLTCQGYTEDFTITKDLVRHRSPTRAGSYLFPYSNTDLKYNEYFITSAVHWANGGSSGPQIFAHDIGVVGFDPQSQQWSQTFGTSYSNNEDYRIWGKPVRAIADGDVISYRDTMDNNIIKVVSGKLQFPEKPTGAPNDWGRGNYILVRITNAELVMFCHFQKGSIPNLLKQEGAKVKTGDIIGNVGNSGRSTNPHTHIVCTISSGALRPFPFHNTWVVDYNKLKSINTMGLWVSLEAEGIPREPSAIYPSYYAPYLNSPIPIPYEQAIDPLALILPSNVYGRLIEWLHPHVPKVDEIRPIFRTMTTEQKRAALGRAKTLVELGNVAIKAAEEELK
jgi:hypothetical protein